MKRKIGEMFAASALATMLTAVPAMAQQPTAPKIQVKVNYTGGAVFDQRVSYNHAPGYRTIKIDCTKLEPVLGQDGSKQLAATVSFMDLFNVLNTEGMGNYTAEQKRTIEQGFNNRSVDPVQVNFLAAHVQGAHGVALEEIKAAGKNCKARAVFE